MEFRQNLWRWIISCQTLTRLNNTGVALATQALQAGNRVKKFHTEHLCDTGHVAPGEGFPQPLDPAGLRD